MKYLLLILSAFAVLWISGCNKKHWIETGQVETRQGSQYCRLLAQKIQRPTYLHRHHGYSYTPSNKAELLQEYTHAGCGSI